LDEEGNKWWFNIVDVVAVLNEQDDYTKANWTDFHITLPDYSYYYEEN